MKLSRLLLALLLGAHLPAGAQQTAARGLVPVTVSNFVRAETDVYFRAIVDDGAFGRLHHARRPTPIEQQDVARMNRDALYSTGVFDLEAGPLAITLPDPGKRFMSMQVISEDHYTTAVVYAPGRHTYTKDDVGTRYVFILIRTLADPHDSADLNAANRLQEAITVTQATTGRFDVPNWEPVSQARVRRALGLLGRLIGDDGAMFGTKAEVDPVLHLIGTSVGWGGNPRAAAVYLNVSPKENDGQTVYSLTVRDVPVDGFWSVSVYNDRGMFEWNARDTYSVNSATARANADGSITVLFGGCGKDTPNCIPIMPGWNYTVRLYRPRKAILDGTWKFPEAAPAS
jgi:para-nitrobenzyl esterase